MSQQPESLEVESVRRTAEQIRAVMDEIQELSNTDVGPEEFYHGFLPRLIDGLGARGGAVWVPADGGALALVHAEGLDPSLVEDDSARAQQHFALVTGAIGRDGPFAVAPNAVDEKSDAANPTEALLLFAPVRRNGRVDALVEIFQRPKADEATRRGYLRFLDRMCSVAERWTNRRNVNELVEEGSLLTQEREFAQLVHQHLDRRRTAYAIANESRRLLDCDRVSVAIRKGRRCVIEAVSGQDVVEKRSDVSRLLARLAAKVIATGEPLWYDGANEDLPPQIESAVGAYVDESFVKTIAVVPLHKAPAERDERSRQSDAQDADPGPVIGALILEQMEQTRERSELEPRVEALCAHSQQALANSLQYHGLFLMPLWRLLGRVTGLFRGRRLPKTLAALGVIAGIVLCLSLIQTDFKLKASGTLEPAMKRDMFAKVDGVVRQVRVKSGQMVDKGELLVELESPTLEAAFGVHGEHSEALQQLIGLEVRLLRFTGEQSERGRLSGEKDQLKARVASLKEELDVLQIQRNNLMVYSEIAGRVATWDVEKLLGGRPVKVGDVLVTVYDPQAGWELKLHMPDKRVGHLNDAESKLGDGEKLLVSYMLATDPGETRYGDVDEIGTVSEPHEEEGSTVKVRVGIQVDDPENPIADPRPGAGVVGHVHCGRESVGYVWFHEAGEAIQRFWFSLF